jgi:hypothetical protein
LISLVIWIAGCWFLFAICSPQDHHNQEESHSRLAMMLGSIIVWTMLLGGGCHSSGGSWKFRDGPPDLEDIYPV